MARPTKLPRAAFTALAAELGESPWTAAAVHLLQRGICEAWTVRGGSGELLGCFIRPGPYPDEPFAFGTADTIWSLAQVAPGWGCLNVPEEAAADVADHVRCALGSEPRVIGDVYLELASFPPGPISRAHPKAQIWASLTRKSGHLRHAARLDALSDAR